MMRQPAGALQPQVKGRHRGAASSADVVSRSQATARAPEEVAADAGSQARRTVDSPDLADLLRRCADDKQAFADIYDATSARLFGLAVRVLRNQALAEEVTQEAYIDIWRLAGRYDPTKGTPHSWMYTVVHRKAVDRVRKSEGDTRRDRAYQAETATHLDPANDEVFDNVCASIEAQRVRVAWQKLPSLQRQAVGLAYFSGLTYNEVGESLGIPVGTAKTRIRAGLRNLRDDLITCPRS